MVDHEDEIDKIRKKLDRMVATMKSNNFKGTKTKKERRDSLSGSKTNSPRKKEDSKRNLKGPVTTLAGPFKPEDSNFQCHKCGGWGHGWKVCDEGKRGLGEDPRGV